VKRKHRIFWGVVIVTTIYTTLLLGQTKMGWLNSDRREVQKMLGADGKALVGDATIKAWQPDANYKPQSYYLLRELGEQSFRQLAEQAGLEIRPSPEVVEAVWELPEDIKLQDWAPLDVPPTNGLQASGTVGAAALWMRWYQDQLFMVALRSSP